VPASGPGSRSRTPAASGSSWPGFPPLAHCVVTGDQLRRHDDGPRAACTCARRCQRRGNPEDPVGGQKSTSGHCERSARRPARASLFRVILNANEGEGLVWLSIPADDFAAAVRFFGETPGLDVAFDEGNTAEPSGRERRQDPAVRPRGTAIRALPQPEASIFPARRTSIRSAAASRYPASQSRTVPGRSSSSGHRAGTSIAWVRRPGTARQQHAIRPWGVYRARYGLEDRAGCDTGD
jgi:hypothetical protein